MTIASILSNNPKAKERFEKAFYKTNGFSVGFINYYGLNFDFQVGSILAWWRSEGWEEFNSTPRQCSVFIYREKYITGRVKKDFTTAFLSLFNEYCKQVK